MGGDSFADVGIISIDSFNPRPRMGGDRVILYTASETTSFNPRPRMGGDYNKAQNIVSKIVVSIHAPAWGATLPAVDSFSFSSFNPRPRMGGDQILEKLQAYDSVSIHAPAWGATQPSGEYRLFILFQSTPPHGGRLQRMKQPGPVFCFNPRPRMGGDASFCAASCVLPWFQSTPPHGGRLGHGNWLDWLDMVSIHAPAWGATLLYPTEPCAL